MDPELSDHSVKVIFTKGREGADLAIIKYCKAHARPREIEVATDDKYTLALHIRHDVGKILSVAELMSRFKPAAARSLALQTEGDGDKRRLSEEDRQAINRTLPRSWFN